METVKTVCKNLPSEFSTSFFRIMIVILVLLMIGIQIFWMLTIKSKVEQAQKDLEQKEKQLNCKACNACNGLSKVPIIDKAVEPVCNQLDCTGCPEN